MKRFLYILIAMILTGCVSTPPTNTNNICDIFRERPSWYYHASRASQKWDAPVSLMMAIMYQESTFKKYAQPRPARIFGVIPALGSSRALGYAQALAGTWDEYREMTGNPMALRTDFEDAVDFMGYYMSMSRKRCGIGVAPAYEHYLAYHEGHGGFNRKTYMTTDKAWLRAAAGKVRDRAVMYNRQLQGCIGELNVNSDRN
jgi:hypothetical protein